MDMSTTTATPTPTPTPTATATTVVKTPEAETEIPTRIKPVRPLSFTNGVLKRHSSLHHHHRNPAVVVTYKECLKNHAASLGGHAVDGCGEFMSSPNSNPSDATSLICAACGCHRNFHRRDPEEPSLQPNTPIIEYQPHHRHHPPQPLPLGGDLVVGPYSPSPPPISSSYAPHMLLALKSGLSVPPPENNGTPTTQHRAKRFRTRFTQEQKGRMLEFAEKVGWKMQKGEDELIIKFCREVGVDRGVLKVWMHNNKNTLGKRDQDPNITNPTSNNNNELDAARITNINYNDNHGSEIPSLHLKRNDSFSAHVVDTNGSSSSS